MEYVFHILTMAAIYSILASSFNLLIGYAGLFALSHAAFYAFGGYTTAILAAHHGVPFPLPILAGVALTALVGAAVSLPALRVSGDYLVIVSLALQVLVLAFIVNAQALTGGTQGITGIPRVVLFGKALDSPSSYFPLALAVAAACFVVAWRVGSSPFGRALRAMRDNESAAEAVGKKVVAMKVAAFAFSGGLAAVAGGLLAHYLTIVGAESFTIETTIYILAMVILGGTGNLWGSVLGAVVLVVLPEALKFLALPPDIADKLRQVIYGLILILVLRLRPSGLLPERAIAFAPTVSQAALAGTTAEAAARHTLPPLPQPRAAGEATLTGSALQRRFGGIVAVSGVDLELQAGRITGIIGPNGAGKTTAFNLLTGFLKPTAGSVAFAGHSLNGLKPHQVVRAGVARSFQDVRLFPRMTVLENVLVALPRQVGDRLVNVFLLPWKVREDERANITRALEVLRFVGLDGKANEIAENLSYAEEKLLSIARLLATGAEVLLFDEPLSGLDPNALEQIFPIVRRLAESGRSVCIIEHNLDVIKTLCDRVYFLDEGKVMAEGTPATLLADPVLAERYLK